MRHINRLATLVAFAGISGAALAQSWVQMWTPPLASHESRVVSSAVPKPMSRVAMDDWIQPSNRLLTRVVFDGALLTPAQNGRWYYLAIRQQMPGSPRPATGILYSARIFAAGAMIGVDGTGLPVYRLNAALPGGFVAFGGRHYWIQISEDDSASARIGIEDFRWSGHRPVMLFPALAVNSAGTVFQPLLDRLDGNPDDLSFALWP